ncbi:CD109 antigen-like [Chironomus tepperi]|uniref:CD109 antigen-like n=1 Tax=Chironomus tepperi TaxID=113505 RepID=UPI00391F2FD3
MWILVKIFYTLLLFVSASVFCIELCTIWTPKSAYETKSYNAFMLVNSVKQSTELSMQFRSSNITIELQDNQHFMFKYPTKRFRNFKSLNFAVTLHRKRMDENVTIHECSTQELEVKPEKLDFNIFIQLDKPIYKPGDDVRFRIIVIDKDMRPYIMNTIDVQVVDPYNRTIQRYTDLEERNIGIFKDLFSLSRNTILGDWKLQVVVDKMSYLKALKVFPVQKYNLPLFAVNIETSSRHYLPESRIVISISARYSFGDFVTGNADLVINDVTTNQTYFQQTFENISGIKSVALNVLDDLGIKVINRMDLQATVTFTEPETGLKSNKSTKFSIHPDATVKMTPVHPKDFIPGLPFDMNLIIKNWKNESIETDEEVQIDYTYKLADGSSRKISNRPDIKKGIAKQEAIVPKDAVEFDINAKFLNSKTYRMKVGVERNEIGSDKLNVDYSPKSPNLHDSIEIFIKGDGHLNKIIIIITSKYGMNDAKLIDCKEQIICTFELNIVEDMMPQFRVDAYFVKSKTSVAYGSANIKTANLGPNHLKMSLSSSKVKSKSAVKFSFDTTENSQIYILAINQRLRYLREGNDVTSDDIISTYLQQNPETEILMDDMTSWHVCTPEELTRVETGRNDIASHSGSSINGHFDDDEFINDFDSNDIDVDEIEDLIDTPDMPIEDGLLREHFPEVWIFDDFEAENSTVDKVFRVPDSMTSWHISAMSVNEYNGIAVAEPQHLVVKNEFFIKFSLPYSIRHKEVLKIDILVFNYIKSNQEVNAKVYLINSKGTEFQFVEYANKNNSCVPSYNNNRHSSKDLTIPGTDMKKVSFYIRSNPSDTDFSSEKFKNIRFYAEGTDKKGKKYKDAAQKKLRIEPIGVKLYDIDTATHVLSGNRAMTVFENSSNKSDTSTQCIISGDYLSDEINLDSKFNLCPGDCLEQKTSRLKGNVQVYKFFAIRKRPQKVSYFSKQYQEVLAERQTHWNNGSSSGYIAYLVDALTSAMELKLIPMDKSAIEKELDVLKDAQTENGHFGNFGSVPDFDRHDRGNTQQYFETAYILVSFLKAKSLVDKDYSDVIDKAFSYLDNDKNKHSVDNEGLSIAAYANVLEGSYERKLTAMELMDTIEKSSIEYKNNKKCLKIRPNDDKCSLRHTAYTALVYLKLDQIHKAMPLIYWLLKSYNFQTYNGYTYNVAIMTEPIAEAAIYLQTDSTDFEVMLKDELNFEKSLRITKENSTEAHKILFPSYSKLFSSTASGHGYCSITKITEKIYSQSKSSAAFEVTVGVMVNATNLRPKEKVVQICAEFDASNSDFFTLSNVIYEVEMPSGYIYVGMVDEEKVSKEISLIEEKKAKTLIIIHYNNFMSSQQYCVDIKAMKLFDVEDSQSASIKVYDFMDKSNIAVEFYKFTSNIQC